MPRKPRKPIRNGGRAKIDWHAAFAYFYRCGAEARSYRDVAERFAVSMTSVRKHARAEKWEERVAALDNEDAAKVLSRTQRSRQERLERTVLAIELARDNLIEALEAGTVEPKVSDLPGLAKTEALIEGEDTERVAMPELLAELRRLTELAGRSMSPEQFKRFLEQIDEVRDDEEGSKAA